MPVKLTDREMLAFNGFISFVEMMIGTVSVGSIIHWSLLLWVHLGGDGLLRSIWIHFFEYKNRINGRGERKGAS